MGESRACWCASRRLQLSGFSAARRSVAQESPGPQHTLSVPRPTSPRVSSSIRRRARLPGNSSIAMPDFLGKRYKLANSENFDELMKALGTLYITYYIHCVALEFFFTAACARELSDPFAGLGRDARVCVPTDHVARCHAEARYLCSLSTRVMYTVIYSHATTCLRSLRLFCSRNRLIALCGSNVLSILAKFRAHSTFSPVVSLSSDFRCRHV